MQWSHPQEVKIKSDGWHNWFAWRPVRIKPGDGTFGPMVWLEMIERKVERHFGIEGGYSRAWYRLKN